jgi:hypothetical protein
MTILANSIIDYLFVNDWIVGILLIFLLVIFFVTLHYFVYDKIKRDNEENKVIGMHYHTASIFYAVLLGFVVVTAWDHFDKAVSNSQNEVNSLSGLYKLSVYFPSNVKEKMQKEIVEYANLMIQEEWPAMQKRMSSPKGFYCTNAMLNSLVEISPSLNSTSNIQYEAFQIYDSFLNARKIRLNENSRTIPLPLIFTLFFGALLTIPFTFLIRLHNKTHQLLMTGIISAFVGLLLSTFLFFESPFRGTISVPSTLWEVLLQHIQENYLTITH